jgi:hypothetical protein
MSEEHFDRLRRWSLGGGPHKSERDLRAENRRLTEAITKAERILNPHITTVPPYPEPDPISQAWVVLAGALGKIG